MIGVRYSCPLCHLHDVEVQIRDRARDEDIAHWMDEAVIVGLARDHRSRSPYCHPDELKAIKIPFPKGTDKIGCPPLS